jgi:hypothetical protein
MALQIMHKATLADLVAEVVQAVLLVILQVVVPHNQLVPVVVLGPQEE